MPADSNTRKPTFHEAVTALMEAKLEDVYVSMIARIESFDASTGRATCKPLVKRPYYDEDGNRQVESIPPIPGVPVLSIGAGGFRATFPVHASPDDGDLCLLVCSDFSLDKWLTGAGQEVDPQIDHVHSLVDAVAIPGIKSFGAPLKYNPTDCMTVGEDDGEGTTIRIKKGGDLVVKLRDAAKIQLGEGATEKVVLGSTFLDLYLNHAHPTGMGPSGIPLVQPPENDVLSTTVFTGA